MKLPLIHIERDACLQLERSMTREWLETDGRGGYASSTILFCPTRRYHGLLVAPPPGVTKRHVFLSRFEESFHGGEKSFPISMARYAGLWSPLGHQGIEHFELVPYPSTVYRFGHARLERDVLMLRGEHTVLVRYRVAGQQQPVRLRLRPLLPFRPADALTFENLTLDKRTERIADGIVSRPYASLPALSITVGGVESDAVHFEADPVWYRGIEYATDLQRGYDGHEDQFSPGLFEIELADGGELFVAATLGSPPADLAQAWSRASRARKQAASSTSAGVRGALELSADDFLYRTEDERTGVIAGFPWFLEWGRDTCISLPGLLLARDRPSECAGALEALVPFLRRGLLPNVFGTTSLDSSYNSADASLWFVRAVRLCELASDASFADRMLPALTEIAQHHRDGTDLGIGSDESGLLHAGTAELNATWMDACTAQGPVTPRDGCAVELNALWYFLLAYLEQIHKRRGEDALARAWGAHKRKASHAFIERFWLGDEHYLADTWHHGHSDRTLRPNMVIAAALEWSPLSRGMRTDIVRHAQAELLTPFGLRTLEPNHPAYCARYAGNQDERDRAYHQGTVWPWLFGFYCEAHLRAFGARAAHVESLRTLLDAYAEQLERYGLNHISEVFDGDPPHRPGGTIAQAWNSAELLRSYRMLEEAAP